MASPPAGYTLVVGLSSILPMLLLPSVLRRRDKPGGTGLAIGLVGVSIYSLSTAFHSLVGTQQAWFLGHAVSMFAANITAIGVFLVAVDYTDTLAPTRRVLAILALVPIAIQALVWTQPMHQLFFQPLETIPPDALRVTPARALYWVHVGVTYAFIFLGILILAGDSLRSSGIRRTQSNTLLGGVLPPSLVDLTGRVPVDLTPFAFIATILILSWALFFATFLDVVPVGRTRVVESMADPVLTLDADDRVVDSNPAARDLVGVSGDWEGMPAAAFFTRFPDQLDRIRNAEGDDVTFTKHGAKRNFDVNSTPLRDPQGKREGTLVVLREITLLKEREGELDLLRQVQSRVLRHNIRNDLTVVKGYNEVFLEELDEEHAPMAEEVIATTEDLLAVSEKAGTIEDLIDTDRRPTEIDLAKTVETIIRTHERQYTVVDFSLETPVACPVQTVPSMETAIENLVENAAEHNDGPDQRVWVTVAADSDETVLTVGDDGPGIPDQELAVLEKGEETQMQHGSGVGLWVVEWVLDHAAATIDFETGADGTEVTIRFPVNADGRTTA